MKIILISSIYPTEQHPDYGTFVRNVHRLYTNSGYEIELVAFDRSGGKLTKLKNLASFYRRIRLVLTKQDSYDLINLHYPFLAAIPLARRINHLSIPLVISVHGSDVFPDSRIKRITWPATKRLLDACARIIVPSRFFQEKMISSYHFPEEKFRILAPGGFDPKLFYPSYDNEPVRKYRIGFAGRLVAGKGWKVLLDAFDILSQSTQADGYQLILAGSGSDRTELEEYAKKIGVLDRIQLLGSLSQTDLAHFYRSLDLFVFPTQLPESLGMVAIEALACGVPLVASDIGAVKEYLIPGENGYLVEPGNAEELAYQMLKLIQLTDVERFNMSHRAVDSVARYQNESVRIMTDQIVTQEAK